MMLPEDLVGKVDAITTNCSAFIAEALRVRLDSANNGKMATITSHRTALKSKAEMRKKA